MAKTKKQAEPKVTAPATEADTATAGTAKAGNTAADAVRAARQAAREAKAAAAQAKSVAMNAEMRRHAERRNNAFGIAASASKVTAVSRSIVSRGRGGRGR